VGRLRVVGWRAGVGACGGLGERRGFAGRRGGKGPFGWWGDVFVEGIGC